jgi:hypothetical protein
MDTTDIFCGFVLLMFGWGCLMSIMTILDPYLSTLKLGDILFGDNTISEIMISDEEQKENKYLCLGSKRNGDTCLQYSIKGKNRCRSHMKQL